MAGERLVHGVVDHLGEQVMQRLLVGAADVHARPSAHRLKPLQHLDVLGGVAGFRRAGRAASWGFGAVRAGARGWPRVREQVALERVRFLPGLSHALISTANHVSRLCRIFPPGKRSCSCKPS